MRLNQLLMNFKKNQKLLKQQIETVRLERKRQTDNKRKKMLAIMKGMLLIEFFKSDETTKHAFGATNLLVTKFTQPIFTDLGPEAYFEYYVDVSLRLELNVEI